MRIRRGSDSGRHDVDPSTAERLIGGDPAPDDAPPPFAAAATVLVSAGGPAEEAELEGEAAAVAMFARECRTTSDLAGPVPTRVGSRAAVAGTAVLVGALLFGGGVAAAATGHLPDAAQR